MASGSGSGSGSGSIPAADYLRTIIHGTTAFELLRTELELDLFERLEAAGGMDLAQVAAALGVDQQPARILLLGLTSLRLLEVRHGRYRNSELVRRRLLRASPRFLGPLVEVQARIINPSLVDLAESVRRNTNVGLRHLPGPGTTLYQRLTAYPELQRVFYANMGDASRYSFAQVLDRYDFSHLRHVVDLGGGDGTNACRLARRYPELEALWIRSWSSCSRISASRGAGIRLDHQKQSAGEITAMIPDVVTGESYRDGARGVRQLACAAEPDRGGAAAGAADRRAPPLTVSRRSGRDVPR